MIDTNKKSKTCFVKIKHNINVRSVKYSNAEKLALDIAIQKGETVFCNLAGDFIFGDFIGAFIQLNNLDVEELTVVSLSGKTDNFELLEALIVNDWVGKITLILSDYFVRTEKAKNKAKPSTTNPVTRLEEIASKNKAFNVFYTNTHAKVVLLKTKQGGKVVMTGSANLRSSQSLEQLEISENAKLYDFQYEFYKNLTDGIR